MQLIFSTGNSSDINNTSVNNEITASITSLVLKAVPIVAVLYL